MIRFLIDASICSALPIGQLLDREVKLYLFYDLLIRRQEADDVVAKIAYSHRIVRLLTNDPHFGRDGPGEWRRLGQFAVVVLSDDVLKALYLNPSKGFLKEFVLALKRADFLGREFYVVEMRQDQLSSHRIEVVGREPRIDFSTKMK